MASSEPVDPEKFVDPDQRCVCGHMRDEHDLNLGHEICLHGWGLGGHDSPPPGACDCEEFQPEEDDHG